MLWRIAAVLPHLRGRVLDVGCGTNDLLVRYRTRSTEPEAGDSVGVDVFDWPGADLLVEDSSDLPWPDASFDTIAIVASLNHIPNRRQVLRECRRLIRPDGQLVVTMLPPRLSQAWHFVRSPWDADQVERGMQPGEVYGLTRDQTDELLLEARFAPIMHRRFMLGLNLLTLARPALTEVVRRPIRTSRPVRATEVLGQPVAARTAESGVRPVPALGATAEG